MRSAEWGIIKTLPTPHSTVHIPNSAEVFLNVPPLRIS